MEDSAMNNKGFDCNRYDANLLAFLKRVHTIHGESEFYETFRHQAWRAFAIFASTTPGFLDLNDQQHYALCIAATTMNTAANDRMYRLMINPDNEPSELEKSYSLEYGSDLQTDKR